MADDRNLSDLLDSPVAFHRVFVDIAGSVHGAVFLSQALYWHRRTPAGRGGWFWKTYEEWDQETGLGRRQVNSARAALAAVGVIETKTEGFPRKTWYRLDIAALDARLEQALVERKHRDLLSTAGEAADADLFAGEASDDSLYDCTNCADDAGPGAQTADASACFEAVCTSVQTEECGAEEPSLHKRTNCEAPSLYERTPSLYDPYTQFVHGVQTDLTEITTEITSSPPAPRARATPPDPTADTQSPQPAWLAREQQRHSASIAAARRELAAGGGAFPLTAEWRPGPDFAGRAQLAGAPGEYTAAQLGEFVSYWSAEGAVARQGQWEHRFLKRLQRDALAAHTQGDYRHATRRPGADTTAIDLHDTSWLDDDALEYARSGAEIGAQARRRAAGKPGV